MRSEKDELGATYWDFYKEVHGIRPRWVNHEKATVEWYRASLESLQREADLQWEEESIALVNQVRGSFYVKNNERFENEYLTGQPDIILDDCIIDIKTSWSLETWPAIPDEGINKDYEWQLRAYCWLLNKQYAELIYCMIDTDDSLLNEWDNIFIHKVSHIDPAKRITVLKYAVNLDYIDEMKEKLTAASEYYSQYINQLNNK